MAALPAKWAPGCLLALGALVLLAGMAHAGDFWKEKPAAEWTAEEALKLVQGSPWAHEELVQHPAARVRATRPPLIARGERRYSGSRDPRTGAPAPERVWGSGPWRDKFAGAAYYLVRWESAIPVVRAFARLEELGEHASAHFQAPPPRLPDDRYVITVKTTRPPRSEPDLFAGLHDKELRERTRLKTTRDTIAPLEVERSGLGANAAVHFFFPRTSEGDLLLRPEGGAVEFRFEGKRSTLKSKFTLDPSFLR